MSENYFAKNKNENVVSRFITMMQQMIFNGTYQVDQRLESERFFAEKYNLSKTVVHEALLQLCQQGFLYAVPRKGYYVADYKRAGKIDCLNALLKYNENKFDPETFDSLIEAILAIEGNAIFKLANKHSDSDIEELELIRDDFSACSNKDIDTMSKLFYKFHHSICYLSTNSMFPLFFNSFADLLILFFKTFVSEYGKMNCLKVMSYLLDSIANSQGQKAYDLLGRLLKQFRGVLKKSNKLLLEKNDKEVISVEKKEKNIEQLQFNDLD